MQSLDDICFDVASGLSQGRRDRQEDAVIADFPLGAPFGFAVLSDGMGGHASGDVASAIVVTEIFSELKLRGSDPEELERSVGPILTSAMADANRCIEYYARENPDSAGMGATLVAPVLFGDRLYWISVGDSPFFLFRGDTLFRLNEDHSFGARIDALQAEGKIAREEATNHPDRNCLISVLTGEEIAQVDCRTEPVTLKPGDVLLAASDGLQTLENAEIAALLRRHRAAPSSVIGNALLAAVGEADCPDQDNLSFCVIRVLRRSRGTLSAEETPPRTDAQAPTSEGEGARRVLRIDRTAGERSVCTIVHVSKKAGRA